MEIVLNYKDFNVNNIHFIEPLNNIIMKKGLHINMVYKKIEYTLNEILLETPIMEAPFGIRKYDESDNKNKNKFYLDLSFKGYDEEQSEIKVFYEKIKQLDEYIVNKSKLFSNKWQLSGKKIEDLYINQIRYNYKDNLNIENFGKVEWYIRVSDQFNWRKVGVSRSIGMLITREPKWLEVFAGMKNFDMFVCVKGKEGNEVLKRLENPKHDAFELERVSDLNDIEKQRIILNLALIGKLLLGLPQRQGERFQLKALERKY